MLQRGHISWFYLTGLLFVAASIVGIAFDFYYILLLPAVLVVAYLAFFAMDKLIILTAFLVPISVTVHDIGLGAGLIIPTEPITFLLMLLAVIKFSYQGGLDKAFLKHPVTIAILVNTAWIFITCFSSTMLLVSFKFLLSRLWFLVVFYFLASRIFESYKGIKAFVWAFSLALIGAVIYVMIRHSGTGFAREGFPYMILPFYWNHGVYSATVSLLTPVLLVFGFYGAHLSFSPLRRSFFIFFGLVFILAVVFSYTRAAWLSLMAAGAVYVILQLRIRAMYLFSALGIALLLVFSYQGEIMLRLSQNEQGSSNKDIEEHLQSVSNIKNDPSNLERINRWSCAIRMFEDKPVFGFGPGTFTFQYAPYQLSKDLTVISTNFGTVGHAHSEYLGPLAESGLLGMLTWLAVFIIIAYRAIDLVYFAQEKETRVIVMAFLLGLVTYFVHGVLNSYFDYDKIAVPFWAFAAAIVCLDIRDHRLKAGTKNEEPVN